MSVNKTSKINSHLPAAYSRRNFIQQCTVGLVALSSGPLLSSLTGSHAVGKKGAAGLRFSDGKCWCRGSMGKGQDKQFREHRFKSNSRKYGIKNPYD